MKEQFLLWFAVMWSLFCMGYVAAITFIQLPTSGQRFADTTLGFLLGTAIAGILGWAYDSTFAQGKKDSPPPQENPQ